MKKLFKKALSITLALTLLISTVFALPTSASAEEKTYQYFSLDYETEDSVTGISTGDNALAAPTNNNTVAFEGENPISGNGSLKYTFSQKNDPVWAFLARKSDLQVTKGHTYRISMKIQTFFADPNGSGGAYLNIGVAGQHYVLHTTDYAGACVLAVNGRTEAVQSVSGTVTAVGNHYLAMSGGTSSVGDSFLLDDVVVAEIIDSVTAAADNESMGTVTVANKDGVNSNFAVNETAVFTATPKEGYQFVCWKDADGNVVSTSASYEKVVTTDTALTAYFDRNVVFTQDFENLETSNLSDPTNFSINTDAVGIPTNGGTKSLFRTATTGTNNLCLPLSGNLKTATKYRLSFDFKKVSNDSDHVLRFLQTHPTNAWASDWSTTTQKMDSNSPYWNFSSTDWQKVILDYTTSDNSDRAYLGISLYGITFYMDNIVLTEVLTDVNVNAQSANDAMGTATVTNTVTDAKGTPFSDYAYKEKARFTAAPNDGYVFVCWKNGDEVVSTKSSYEMEITDSVTLTAYFEKAPFRGDLFQDFESYYSGDLGMRVVGAVQITADPDDAENTVAFYEGATAANVSSTQNRFVLNPKAAFSNAAYTTGSQFTLRFRYKVTTADSVTLSLYGCKAAGNAWDVNQNVFDPQGPTLTKTSGWETKDVTVTVKDGTKFPYFSVFVGGDGTVCLDDIMIFKTVNIPITYQNETVRLVTTADSDPFTAARINNTVTFRAECDSTVTPTVQYGDTVLTADENGLYTVTVTESDAITVTTTGQTSAQDHAPGVGLNGEDLTKYDPDVFMTDIWECQTVYHEAVMFADTSDGYDQTTKTLLYPVDDIVSIRSANLGTYYIKGVDYQIENGKIVWLEGGQMPIYKGPFTVPQTAENENYDDAVISNGNLTYAQIFPTDDENGLYLMYDGYHERYTVYVTYTHTKTWEDLGQDGYTPETPENQSYDMKPFYDKLETGEAINVLVYGDSTATGCSSSGANMNYDLFDKDNNVVERGTGSGIKAPTFFEQATAKLVSEYGNGNAITYYNIALGGKNAAWGNEKLSERVGVMNTYYGTTVTPDIIYVKFCANDMSATVEGYQAAMSGIVAQFKTLYPNAVIVLVSGKINNEKTTLFSGNHDKVLAFEDTLAEIADANTNCIVAKTTSVWAEIVKSKNYEDYLSNNINHANDFWAKVTAQIIVAAAEKQDTVSAITTAYNNFAAIRPASESSTGKNGLRIYNEIKTEWLDAANIVEYGSIAIRTARLSGAELKYDTANAAKGIAYSDGTHSAQKAAQLWSSTAGAYVFTSYLTNIPEQYYGASYSVRAYAIDENGNIYYGDILEISLYEVANAIDHGNRADGNAPTAADQTAFYAFVSEANNTAYQAWCAENGKATGALFQDRYGA